MNLGAASTQRKFYIAARSRKKAQAAIKDLKQETGKEAIFLQLDLADMKSVKAGAEEFTRYVHFLCFLLTVTNRCDCPAKRQNCMSCLTTRASEESQKSSRRENSSLTIAQCVQRSNGTGY